jgi:hypothetical protein
MAWIDEKANGEAVIVRWRDADGKKKSMQFRWGVGPEPKSEAEVRANAERWAATVERPNRKAWRIVRNHIDGHPLAMLDIRRHGRGPGRLQCVAEDRAVGVEQRPAAPLEGVQQGDHEGIIEVNPLKRAPDVKRMKVRRPDERPLDIPTSNWRTRPRTHATVLKPSAQGRTGAVAPVLSGS